MIELNFDGSCDPNPGGICNYGFVARRGGTRLHGEGGRAAPRGPGATNNVAEYTGAIRALEWARANAPGEAVVLRGDSELAVRQLRGEYKVKSKLLAPLHRRATELMEALERVDVEWIPRERNAEADALAKRGAAGGRS